MTKSIQQIKQDLDNTESAVAETAIELQNRYRNYLELLSQSVQQQLILASYQICTQFYPQSFLNLSLSNKQDLQQALRQISIDLQPVLLEIIEQQELEPEPNELNLMAELIANLPKSKNSKKSAPESELENSSEEIDLELVKAELANLDNVKFIEIDTIEEISDSDVAPPQSPAKQKIDFKNPEHLMLWHKQIERKIKKILDNTSKNVNKHLQNSGIIPDRIPSKIVDVALQTNSNSKHKHSRKLPAVPNVLHLAIETDKNKKSKPAKNADHISLLRLRLSEIEFSDPMLNVKRTQIRDLMGKISKLNGRYKANKHHIAIAQAQAAWRSSWYEG